MATTTKAKKTEETVRYRVQHIPGEPNEVTVGVNGVMYKIQRGVWVEVPRAVAEVLDNSELQTLRAEENSAKLKEQVTNL